MEQKGRKSTGLGKGFKMKKFNLAYKEVRVFEVTVEAGTVEEAIKKFNSMSHQDRERVNRNITVQEREQENESFK